MRLRPGLLVQPDGCGPRGEVVVQRSADWSSAQGDAPLTRVEASARAGVIVLGGRSWAAVLFRHGDEFVTLAGAAFGLLEDDADPPDVHLVIDRSRLQRCRLR